MARISASSNPTNIREISRKHVSLESTKIGDRRFFQLSRLELDRYGIRQEERIIVIARSGNTSRRFELGTAGSFDTSPQELGGLDPSHPLRFRLLVRDSDSTMWSASSENLRFSGEGDVESLLPIESTDLGQRLWRVLINEEGAVIQCNNRIFPTGTSAETYAPFCALVLPEALRQVLVYIARDPQLLNSEGTSWADWKDWMHRLKLDPPPSEEGAELSAWLEESIAAFCDEHKFADVLQTSLGGAHD